MWLIILQKLYIRSYQQESDLYIYICSKSKNTKYKLFNYLQFK